MICKAASYDKRLCMIDSDRVAIGHVSGSHQLGRVLHEVIIFIIIVTRRRRGGSMCSACTEQVFEVMAGTARGGRAVHPVPRTRAAMHAEAAVQERKMRPHA
jgi:hypothetical protein